MSFPLRDTVTSLGSTPAPLPQCSPHPSNIDNATCDFRLAVQRKIASISESRTSSDINNTPTGIIDSKTLSYQWFNSYGEQYSPHMLQGQIGFSIGRGTVENAVFGNAGRDAKMDGKNSQLGANPAPALGFLPRQGKAELEMTERQKHTFIYRPYFFMINPSQSLLDLC